MLYNILLFVHVISTVLLIVIVLLQTGKGSEVGFAFGAGAAQTMFGSSGGSTFIKKITITFAVLFMVTSILLAFIQAKSKAIPKSVMNDAKTEQTMPGTAPVTNNAQPIGQENKK
ncbi:MAG: preprotein translocase subunit SecG [bacterium]